MPDTPGNASRLLLGPLLRHVGPDSATIWAEVSARCRMEVLGCGADSFEVAGHHYALVIVTGLAPGTLTPYEVHLDGVKQWPLPESPFPQSVIATLAPGQPVRINFGSCRATNGEPSKQDGPYGADALEALAVRLAHQDPREWPTLLLMLGDQVYADMTSPQTRAKIDATRGLDQPPGAQVADFEEYTWLYQESWSLPRIRWLMSSVPVSMIFDDHDIHDDWNTSRAWRQQLAATDWWHDRVTGGLMAYWVYQHLGNLSPAELAADPVYAQVSRCGAEGTDAGPWLRSFAAAADKEADGAKGYRWSYVRDLGRTRLVVLDSRCGRILDGTRSMLSEEEFDWALGELECDADHVLIGTSLPWLLAPALHAIESWNEARCDRKPSGRGLAERLRQGVDLEHWAAFGASFESLGKALLRAGSSASAPATICVLSGDVHHSYLCEAFPAFAASSGSGVLQMRSRLFQVTCSPFANAVPGPMLAGFRVAWNGWAATAAKRAARAAGIAAPGVNWSLSGRVLTGNAVARIELDGRSAQVVFESAALDDGTPALTEHARYQLT